MLCSCGSGRPFDRCHGDPANEFARDQALAEARQIALLFPSVRLSGRAALEQVALVTSRLAEDEDPDDIALQRIVDAAGVEEGQRVVDGWTSMYQDRWASLCHTAADVPAAERELLRGAAAASVHERLPTPRDRLIELELADMPPGPALAFLIPPQFVWSFDEARAAALAGLEKTEELAAALGRIEHVDRLHALAGFVERELPFAGFPRTSEALVEAVAAVKEDLGIARSVTALSLAAYVHELALSYSTSRD